MAAPEYVPVDPTATPHYQSPDVVPEPWTGDRPGSLGVRQPQGSILGYQGPDQGYALTLTRLFDERIVLTEGESSDDVMAAAVQIAMKRASLYGRAPVVHDLEIALRVWGFLDEAPSELVAERSRFEGVANPHHWYELREVVSAVPESTLRMSPEAASSAHRGDWRRLLDLD